MLFKQIRKMQILDWVALFKLLVTYIPGKVIKFFVKDIWVISEYKDKARDNGYWLFKYIREKQPQKKVYYVIDNSASDFDNVKEYGNIISFGSISHYVLFWAANKYIGTTKYYGFPYGRICEDLVQWGVHDFKNIFINHGVARGYSSIVDARETNYDLVIALSDSEKEIMISENNQPIERIQTLGFCRYDNLDGSILNVKRILIMPTWRNWLDYRLINDKNDIAKINSEFLKSSYYREFNELISDSKLMKFIETEELEVLFYLHDYAQVFSQYFESKSPNIIIADKNSYSIQDLLKSSSFLITDYSSVVYDYAYMKKSLVYFQFDKELFEKNQYAEGENFTYLADGFGDVLQKREDVVENLINSYKRDFIIQEKYLRRVNEYFEFHDKNHCERTYNVIENM